METRSVKPSAGILMRRVSRRGLEVLLVHPGGPYWAKKDGGAWSIPKGEVEPGEDPLETAVREFQEETGFTAKPPFAVLGQIRQKSGKTVLAWSCVGDCDPARVKSNLTTIEWPPRSGKTIEIPEIDAAAFFTIRDALEKANPAQASLIERLRTQFPVEYDRSAGKKSDGSR